MAPGARTVDMRKTLENWPFTPSVADSVRDASQHLHPKKAFLGGRTLWSEVWVLGFEFGTITCRFSLIVRDFESNRHP
jgi:hypothetical protein